MASGVNVKMGVSGVAQFKQSINQSKQAIKTLDAQLALSEKQFKASGDAESYMAEKSELLKAKLEQQKSIAENAEKALKDMAEKGADRSSKAYQDLYQQMLAAKGAMLDTESEMQGVESAGNEAAEGVSNMNEQLAKVGEGVSWQNVNSALKSITDGMEAAMKKAIELGKVIVKEVLGAGNWADDLHTRATYFGISDEELQKMEKTATLIDTPVDAIINARKKLKKAVAGGNEDIFEALGLDPAAADNSEDLFWKVGAALMKLGDEYTQEEYAQKIFGRSWNELIPLFEAGRKEYDKLNESWSVVPEENLKQLQEMDDQYQILKNDLETTKYLFLSELAPAVKSVMEVLTGLVGKFNEYLQTEKGQEMMESLSNAVSSLFEGLTKVSPEDVINKIQGVLDKVVDGLKWIDEHGDAVVKIAEGFVAAWAGLKVTQGMTTVLQLINGVKGLRGGGGTPSGGGDEAAGGAASSGGGAAVSKEAWKASLFGASGGWGVALPAAGLAAGGYAGAKMIEANLNDENLNQIYGDEEGKDLLDRMTDAQLLLAKEYEKIYNDPDKMGTEEAFQMREALQESLKGLGIVNDEQGVSLLENIFEERLREMDIDGMVEKFDRLTQEAEELSSGDLKQSTGDLAQATQNLTGLPAQIESAAAKGIARKPIQVTVNLDGNYVKTYIDQALGAQLAGLFG